MASETRNELEEERRPLLEASQAAESGPSQQPPEQEQQRVENNSFCRQVFLGVVVALPSVAPGMSFGFSAIALDQLRLTLEEASWFASVTAMGYPVGSLIVGPLMDRYGRRPALLSINFVSLVGWLLLAINSSRPTMAKLLIGRVLTGIAGGLASVPASVYAAECLCPSTLHFRSAMVTWSTVALCVGIFLVYTLGSFLPYYEVASMATLISIFAFVLVAIFLTESPPWLVSKGRHSDAELSQRALNITPSLSPADQPSEDSSVDTTLPASPLPPPRTLNELRKPEAYKPLFIMIGFFFFQQFSGVFVVIAYMVDIIKAAGVVTLNAYLVTVIAGTIIVVVALSASLIYPNTGVRSIAAVSGAGIAGTMLFIGSFLEFQHFWVARAEWYFLNWIPLFVILGNVAISTVGFLILPWSMMGEVFPTHVKGIAAGIATCIGFIFSFIAAKSYPFIHAGLGASGMFFFFGIMALFGTIYVLLFLPETRGKTLQQILEGFSSSRRT